MRAQDLNVSLWNLSCALVAVGVAGCVEHPRDDDPEAVYQAAYLEADDPADDCGLNFDVVEVARPPGDGQSLTFMNGGEAARDLDGDGAEEVLVREGTRFFLQHGGAADCRIELDDLRFATDVAIGDLDGNGRLNIAFNDGQAPLMVEIRPSG